MQHVAPEGVDESRQRREMFEALMRLVFLVEEKPVITRFFLFTPCCFALLWMFLLRLPSSIFSAGAMNPEAENGARLAVVRSFYERPESQALVRRQCPCLWKAQSSCLASRLSWWPLVARSQLSRC